MLERSGQGMMCLGTIYAQLLLEAWKARGNQGRNGEKPGGLNTKTWRVVTLGGF